MKEMLWLSLRSLFRNPGRTGLTVLGLSIGVAAFIAMVSFGIGARSSVLDQFKALGVNTVSLSPRGARPGGRPPSPLTVDDVEALLRETTTIARVVPVASRNTVLAFEGREHVTKIRATVPEFATLQGWKFSDGGMFDSLDLDRRAKVCVLGARLADALFSERDPLGRELTVNSVMKCRVIGVLASKGVAMSGRDLDDILVMPYTTLFTHMEARKPVFNAVDIRPKPQVTRAAVETEIRATLRHTHGLEGDAEDDFTLRSPDDAIRVADEVAAILTNLLAGIAAVSLLVGGIGIMNIQLVAVAERTQEIGIRSAIGASPRQIMAQFLTEAVLLALLGTFLGSLAGVGLALGVAKAMRWTTAVPVGAILGAVAFGAGVGVLFGYLPAQRAARLDPIEALRRE